jgi:hypothetical protein
MDWPAQRFGEALQRRELNRQALLSWVKSNLKGGIDYGQIHVVGKDKCRMAQMGKANECLDMTHWSKPSLWKPGAEKICGMLGLIPRFPNLSEYEGAAIRGEEIKVILIKCELRTASGFVAAEGTGARRVTQDYGDINKSLKMAEKSAHIDATLRVAGLSELFTQDLEDMENRQGVQPQNGNGTAPPAKPDPAPASAKPEPAPASAKPEPAPASTKPEPSPPPQDSPKPAQDNPKLPPRQTSGGNGDHKRPADNRSNGDQGTGNRITGKQYKYIMSLTKEAGMTKAQLNEHCVQAYGSVVDHISRNDASSLIEWLLNK